MSFRVICVARLCIQLHKLWNSLLTHLHTTRHSLLPKEYVIQLIIACIVFHLNVVYCVDTVSCAFQPNLSGDPTTLSAISTTSTPTTSPTGGDAEATHVSLQCTTSSHYVTSEFVHVPVNHNSCVC